MVTMAIFGRKLKIMEKMARMDKTGPEVIKLFAGSDKHIILFFMLINVKMPTLVGILTIMSRKNFMLI